MTQPLNPPANSLRLTMRLPSRLLPSRCQQHHAHSTQSIAALDWFVTHLTQIKDHDWMAQAITTGCNPLVGYTCAASGVTIELALTNLLSKLNNNFDFVPPPSNPYRPHCSQPRRPARA